MLDGYSAKLEMFLKQDGDVVTLNVKALQGVSINLSNFTFYIAQYNGDKLISVSCPAGVLGTDGYTKYSGTLPTGDFKLLYWTQNMEPVIQPVTN